MKHIEKRFEYKIEIPKILSLYIQNCKIGVLDIETTGLYGAKNKLILGGLLVFEEEGMAVFKQYFAEDRMEETEVLSAYLEELKGLDYVFTYNGDNFDMPFITKRCEYHHIDAVDLLPVNLDIYKMLKTSDAIKQALPNLKQKTVEHYFGISNQRRDEISGKESIDLYNDYCKTKDKELLRQILLHNADDIKQLSQLIPIIKKIDIHLAMAQLGFLCKNKLKVTSIKVSENAILVDGKQLGKKIEYISYGDNCCETIFNSKKGDFKIKLPISNKNNMKILDYENIVGKENMLLFKELEKYPFCGSGYLVVAIDGQCNFREINHFLKRYIEMIAKGE